MILKDRENNLIYIENIKRFFEKKNKRKWQTYFDGEKEIQLKIINTSIRSNKPQTSMITYKSNENEIKKKIRNERFIFLL